MPPSPILAKLDIAHLIQNNIYAYGIAAKAAAPPTPRDGANGEKRFDTTRIHPYVPLADLPTALRYARDRIDDAIKVVVTDRDTSAIASAAGSAPET